MALLLSATYTSPCDFRLSVTLARWNLYPGEMIFKKFTQNPPIYFSSQFVISEFIWFVRVVLATKATAAGFI